MLLAFDIFEFSGEIKSGIPSFQVPPFNFERPEDDDFTPPIGNWTDNDGGNQTYETVTFDAILKDLGPGMILVPVVAILEQVAIAKAFCKLISKKGKSFR